MLSFLTKKKNLATKVTSTGRRNRVPRGAIDKGRAAFDKRLEKKKEKADSPNYEMALSLQNSYIDQSARHCVYM